MLVLVVVCVDAGETHLATRERHNLVGRCGGRDALSIEPALDAAGLVAPAGGAGFNAVLLDVGFEVHITDGDTCLARCQALFVLFFRVRGGRYNSRGIYPHGRSP